MKASDPLVSIDVLKRVRMAILSQGLIRESCIASTAIYIAVLREFGVKAEPVTVKAAAINAQFVKFIAEHNGEIPKDEDGLKKLKESGARTVEVGFHTRDYPSAASNGKPSWNGHLVVGVRPREGQGLGFLLDLSIDSANRPEKGIHLPNPLVVPVPAPVWKQTMAGQMVMTAEIQNGGQVEYVVVPGDASYTISPDWNDRKTRWRDTVKEITSALCEYLADKAKEGKP